MSANVQVKEKWQVLPFKGLVYLSIGAPIVTALIVFLLKSYLPPVVPLFFGEASGDKQLTSAFGLFIAPGASLAVSLINLSIALMVKELFLKKILVAGAALFSALLTITVLKVIFLVGFF